ncbi:hypothetical protein ACFY1V_17450 [Streptomyces sp. NPDC001255]|uniref:Nucleotidyltransferase family protein n=1 Tax=Streptomyces evansiae TaxID=3075535 RepID=A0ABD5E9V1_9ACTN|nr:MULTISPECIES: hypothetical protein [unclassified Streptomyces]MDT0418010.1 hypothetical protein [Streptomyces sp. DSM 41982]SCD77255.1 hypothetical protein GA0115246_105864 [Streptomyces sp. SolWspMP-sol7th]
MELSAHPLVKKLLSLHLPVAEYVVAGSGPLLAHGLREDVGDLDVVARGEAWKRAEDLHSPAPAPSGHGHMVVLFNGAIEVFDTWLPGTQGPDELIDRAEMIQGIPFCPLTEVLDWKRRADREKDHADVTLIEHHLRAGP